MENKDITILIVDDAKFMRVKLRKILEDAGYSIVGEAQDGKEAVKMYSELRPTITTMDITMPEVDGITAMKAIKTVNPAAKIIMISALGQKEKVRESIFAGAMDFIIKPFTPEKVTEVLSRIAAK